MSEIFGNDRNIRGCFHVFSFNGSASRGASLRLPGGGQIPWGVQMTEPILTAGFSVAQAEAVSFVKVFGDRVYTYAFGHDPNPSMLTVEFIGFLIDKTRYSGVLDDYLERYRTGRVSEALRYAKFGVGSEQPMRGFIVGMGSGTMDGEHSLQRFSMTLALVEVQ